MTQFTSDPEQGQVSNRTAFVRNNGLADGRPPSFTIVSNRCVHLGCPTQPGGQTDVDATQDDPARGQAPRSADPHESVRTSPAPATAAPTISRATE